MKRFVLLCLTLCLSLSLAMPCFAGTLNLQEERLLRIWQLVLESYEPVLEPERAADYYAVTKTFFLSDDINLTEDAVDVILQNALYPAHALTVNDQTKQELLEHLPNVLDYVNSTLGMYQMCVSVDVATGAATLIFRLGCKIPPDPEFSDAPEFTTPTTISLRPIVKQTGSDLPAGTLFLPLIFLVAFAGGCIVIRKHRLLSRHD